MDTLIRLTAIFDKGGNFCDFLFAFCNQSPSEKESSLKGKNLLPKQILSF